MSEHKLEVSPSGRATCRTCKTPIAKDVLRFGNSVPDTFSGAGFRLEWHHVACAVTKFPEALSEALSKYEGDVPDRAVLEAQILKASQPREDGTGGGRGGTPNADHAPTGRAKCTLCEQPIEKGSIRIGVEREAGSSGFAGVSYLHPACASAWVETHFPDGMDAFRKRIDLNTSLKLDEIRLA